MTNSTDKTPAPSTDAAASLMPFNRLQALVKSELSSLILDAEKKTPLFSNSPTEAQAKKAAIVKAYSEFLTMARSLKEQ